MEKLILDTNIIVHLVRGNHIAEVVNQLVGTKKSPQLFVSVVSIAEVESLALQWGWSEKKVNAIRRLFDGFVCIDIAAEQKKLIEAYIAIDAFSQGKIPTPGGLELNDSSRNMGKNDLWIAATAYAINAELITTDGDFDHLNNKWITVHKF